MEQCIYLTATRNNETIVGTAFLWLEFMAFHTVCRNSKERLTCR